MQPARPRRAPSVVVVPVASINRLAEQTLCTAMSMGDRVIAVHVVFGTEADETAVVRQFQQRWS